ncbi:hypothetical protein Kpol_1030p33, partial [Vanderwaltozyma polyspora DSM 70294]
FQQMYNTETSPKATALRSRSNTIYTDISNTNSTVSSGSNGTKKNRKNLVLSTSFLSTKRPDNGPISPNSPLQGKWKKNSLNKNLVKIKNDINQLNQTLYQTKKKKKDAETLLKSTSLNIYTGTYSTSHLEKHSMRIKANTQIRELDNSIKKLEKQISESKLQYEVTVKSIEPHNALDGNFLNSANTSREDLISHSYEDEGYDTEFERPDTSDISLRESLQRKDAISYDSLIPDEDLNIGDDEFTYSRKYSTDEYIAANRETAIWLISDYMQSLQTSNTSVDFIIRKANDFVTILRDHPEIREDLLLTPFLPTLQQLLLNDDKFVVSAAFRICRYLVDGPQFIETLKKLEIDAFIVISLGKENIFQIEREQALKLARTFGEHKKLSKSMLQALISCIEKPEDSLKNMALETLLELCFIDPELVTECNGIRVLENLLQDYSSFSLAKIILDTILQLISTQETRKYFLKDFSISVLATTFSDTNTKSASNVERLQNSAILISKALKNADGCRLFSINNFKPLKDLLSFFEIPLCASYLVDIFLDVLRIKPLQYKFKSKSTQIIGYPASSYQKDCIPINQNVALLILILNKSNFVNQLLKVINNNKIDEYKDTLVNKARYLLIEYLNLAANLVDAELTLFNDVIPKGDVSIFRETYQFGKITYILNKNRNTLGLEKINYTDNIQKISQDIKANTLIRQVDDLKFRRMVFDSKVLQVKDFSLWNWNVIQELLEGPLTNARQLEELGKTKFIRKLLVFYRPLRQRFSNVDKKSRLAQKYIQVGCKFFKMLTLTSEGMKILMDDNKIIPQLASLLFRAMEGKTDGNIFNEISLKTKTVVGYFKFIGVLTKSLNGTKVLDKWNFFTVIYKMFQIENKLSFTYLMYTLPEIDLRFSPHCRTIMGKALVIGDEQIRLNSTQYMSNNLKEITEMINNQGQNNNTKEALTPKLLLEYNSLQQYMLEMLTRQLFDLSPKVVAVADQSLYEHVVRDENTSTEVGTWLRTSLNQMVFISSPILFELMSSKYGFQILNEIQYIEHERESWLLNKNLEYVSIVEEFIDNFQTFGNNNVYNFEVSNRLPLHFYESLAKTDDGINLLTTSGDLVKFMNVIKKYRTELKNGDKVNESLEDIIELKCCIWCCGYIGSTPLGIGLIDNYSIVEDFITLTYEATVTSVRSTAFYALGLIAKTKEGCEILDEMGWICSYNVFGEPVGIATPKRIDSYLSYKESQWKIHDTFEESMISFDISSGNLVEEEKIVPIKINLDDMLTEKYKNENPLIENKAIKSGKRISSSKKLAEIESDTGGYDKIIDKVVESVCELSNHILMNKAIKEIGELKEEYEIVFENYKMFYKIFELMTKFRFKPNIRKFLFNLFINKKSLKNAIAQSSQ